MSSLPLAALASEMPLVREVVCPNCWHNFPPESALWISVNPRLAGEPQLDSSVLKYQRRFIPERFDPEGRALDAEGSACTQLACPRCRLQIPRASFDMPNVVMSLLGAPGSGKSVFLTSLIYSIRQQAARLGLRFQDADLNLNKKLLEDERLMFLDAEADSFRPISVAVEKTKLADDDRYQTSRIDGHGASFLKPFTFIISPTNGHPRADEGKRLSQLLCLYDNAGEHFRPGSDHADKPMTRHLAASKGLMYVFDPTKDRRLRRQLGDGSAHETNRDRQDVVLIEAANRIREHAGIAQTAQIPQTLVVVLTKYDVWRSLVPGLQKVRFLSNYPGSSIDVLNWDDVEAASKLCRDFLWSFCPEVINTADSISQTVIYVPVAAVGWDVQRDETGESRFSAANCEPFGVLVPLLSLLARSIGKVVPSVKRRSS